MPDRSNSVNVFYIILLFVAGYVSLSFWQQSSVPTAPAAKQTAPSDSLYLNDYQIPNDLKIGDQGEGVRMLQEFLNKTGYTIATSGPGSSDNWRVRPGHGCRPV